MHSESKIQADIVRWYNNAYCLTNHSPRCMILSIPNGGTRNKTEAITLKSTGLLPGASDLIVLHGPHLLWVEVKMPTGYQSPEQRIFQQRVEALGYKYILVRSLLEFQEIISNLDR